MSIYLDDNGLMVWKAMKLELLTDKVGFSVWLQGYTRVEREVRALIAGVDDFGCASG